MNEVKLGIVISIINTKTLEEMDERKRKENVVLYLTKELNKKFVLGLMVLK